MKFVRLFSANHSRFSSLFSTRVINGAKSTPELNKLLEHKHAGRTYIDNIFLRKKEVSSVNIVMTDASRTLNCLRMMVR